MKAEEKDNGIVERTGLEGGSAENLISEILRLVQQQTETLKRDAISPEWAAAYKSRAWKIRELLNLLGPRE